ncbi:hypothetical protein F5Y16DRAFT_419373 [Xylariaceae sp. FL0255]|nr:hypothetical protein F5Y16DRAFT_419373 [Xylariaceae sp. FL0255]
MKSLGTFIRILVATYAVVAALGDMHPKHLPRALEKRDAYTCYSGNVSADTAADCQGAVDQLQQYGDQEFSIISGLCLEWSQKTCKMRFCAQPWVLSPVNQTASWLYGWGNGTLMACLEQGKFALMGDSLDLNGKEGTYRVWLEQND